MEFYTACDTKRPVRLTEATRLFAYESLDHKYGLDTRRVQSVTLDHIENFESLTRPEKYNVAIYEIATKAPIRIIDGELISGAATLGNAIDHLVPASYKGECICGSISHVTLGFGEILKYGYTGLRKKAEQILSTHTDEEKIKFVKSCIHALDCFEIWHKRYIKALKGKKGFEKVYENLLNVPANPPKSFYEAVQSLWFTFAFLRLCGNWPGIGRIDVMLGDYLENDLKNNVITIDEAREIMAHFFIKGCEWICGGDYWSGDAQHYQNLVIGGVGEDGCEVTNDVTYLCLDVIEELGISDYPTTVRINKNSPEKLISRMGEVIRHGGGTVAVYNEDLILKSLTDYGYSLTEARKFANDGCWEVQVPGKTYFSYISFDSLAILQHITLDDYRIKDIGSYDELYNRYIADLGDQIELIYENTIKKDYEKTPDNGGEWKWRENVPCPLVSVFVEGCMENGLSYLEGGPVYKVTSPHIGGLPDVANSLYAVKKLVFEEKKIGFNEFMDVLANDWKDSEPLRRYVLSAYDYYGNDNDEVDLIAADILDKFADKCATLDGRCPYAFPAGVSTFGRQIEWAPTRLSSPHGRKKGEVLSGNFSPTPGSDKNGATAIIKSCCKADMTRQVTGAALDVNLMPTSVKGQDGADAIAGLIRGFVLLGGHFMQLDVSDSTVLKQAQERPEDYPTLSVRVSGWNARFVTMNKEWQDMIIERVEKGE